MFELPGTILLIIASAHGQWTAGTMQTIWFVAPGISENVQIDWRLSHNQITVSKGRYAARSEHGVVPMKIQVPDVRTRLETLLMCTITSNTDPLSRHTGSRKLILWPDAMIELASVRVALLGDQNDPVLTLLNAGHVRSLRLTAVPVVRSERHLILIIMPSAGQLTGFEQSHLHDLIRSGADVVFLSNSASALLGPSAPAPNAREITINGAHPFNGEIGENDWSSWLADAGWQWVDCRAGDEVIVFGEKHGEMKDRAAVLTRQIGDGRLVFCGLPGDSLRDDGRASQLLANVLNYLSRRDHALTDYAGGLP